jgi:hypothetical protein
MSARDVIRRHGRTYSVSRPGVVTVTDGYAIPGAPATITVFAHAQTLSGEELRNLPPGENSADWRIVWSLDELQLRDKITIDGDAYSVQRISPWPAHWQANVSKVRDSL